MASDDYEWFAFEANAGPPVHAVPRRPGGELPDTTWCGAVSTSAGTLDGPWAAVGAEDRCGRCVDSAAP